MGWGGAHNSNIYVSVFLFQGHPHQHYLYSAAADVIHIAGQTRAANHGTESNGKTGEGFN